MRGHTTTQRRPDEEHYRPRHARDDLEGRAGRDKTDVEATERESATTDDG